MTKLKLVNKDGKACLEISEVSDSERRTIVFQIMNEQFTYPFQKLIPDRFIAEMNMLRNVTVLSQPHCIFRRDSG